MSGKAAKVPLTDRMFQMLTQLSTSRKASVAIAHRAMVILLAFQKRLNREIAAEVDLSAKSNASAMHLAAERRGSSPQSKLWD